MAVTPVTVRLAFVIFAERAGCIKVYLPASVPPNTKPDVVTDLLLPAFLFTNVPVAPTEIRVTLSPVITPLRVALPVFNVAAVVPL